MVDSIRVFIRINGHVFGVPVKHGWQDLEPNLIKYDDEVDWQINQIEDHVVSHVHVNENINNANVLLWINENAVEPVTCDKKLEQKVDDGCGQAQLS